MTGRRAYQLGTRSLLSQAVCDVHLVLPNLLLTPVQLPPLRMPSQYGQARHRNKGVLLHHQHRPSRPQVWPRWSPGSAWHTHAYICECSIDLPDTVADAAVDGQARVTGIAALSGVHVCPVPAV